MLRDVSIRSPADSHLGCFHPRLVMKTVAINTYVHVLSFEESNIKLSFYAFSFLFEDTVSSPETTKMFLYILKSIYGFLLSSHLEVTSVCLRQECNCRFPWVCGQLSRLCTLDFKPRLWSVGSLCTVIPTSVPLDLLCSAGPITGSIPHWPLLQTALPRKPPNQPPCYNGS